MRTVFVSYSHKDEAWKDKLLPQLRALEQAGVEMNVWQDRQIDAGAKWYPEIRQAMADAAVAVLLISADYLASGFCVKEEVPFLLERQEKDGMLLIPLLIRQCPWKAHRWLSERQMLPRDGKCVAIDFPGDLADLIFSQVAAQVCEFLLKLGARPRAFESRTEAFDELVRIWSAIPRPPSPEPAPRVDVAILPPDRIDLTRLPDTGSALFGRDEELKLLDAAWDSQAPDKPAAQPTRILAFTAHGGVGKSTLVNRWLDEMQRDHFRGATRVFGWSFFSQGAREQGTASAETFVAAALRFFGDRDPNAGSPYDKGERLARLVSAERALLVLDGMEPLQSADAFERGKLRDPALESLLRGLARYAVGLCLITTREPLTGLAGRPGVVTHDLEQISPQAGRALLRTARVVGTDAELEALAQKFGPHALAISLLGVYLREQPGHGLDPARLIEALPGEKPIDRVLAGFEQWLADSPELEALRLLGFFDRPADEGCFGSLRAAPAIPGLTDRLAGITDAAWDRTLNRLEKLRLVHIRQYDSGKRLVDAHPFIREHFAEQVKWGSAGASPAVSGAPAGNTGAGEATPSGQPAGARVGTCEGACAPQTSDAWREAHRRLYEHLCARTKEGDQPTLEDLQPLYQAVAHGCQAGLQQEACDKVYFARIMRRGECYSSKKLGAFGSDLGAVACFFETPWSRVSPALTEADQAWLLNQAAFRLRALGRLTEALDPMRAGLPIEVKREDWKNAALRASNLSELELTLGEVAGAVGDAEQSVAYADRSGDAFSKTVSRTIHADALHQAGRRAEAEARFREAEQMQAESQPEYKLLYSLPGFRYCDLLLAEAERAAWRICLGSARAPRAVSGALAGNIPGALDAPGMSTPPGQPARARVGAREGACASQLQSCRAVSERAAQTLKWANQVREASLLTIALDHLSLGRAALYAAILESRSRRRESAQTSSALEIDQRGLTSAATELDAAVSGLRRAGEQIWLTAGLLTRAWQRSLTGSTGSPQGGARTGPESAQSDLDEAWEIAARGPMPLFLAEVHLHRARLFGVICNQSSVVSGERYPWESPTADLAEARRLIEKHGYGRRKEELEDAEAVLLKQHRKSS